MKYPNVVDGAIAASAPIYYFGNREELDINIFYKIATEDYNKLSNIIYLDPQSENYAPSWLERFLID